MRIRTTLALFCLAAGLTAAPGAFGQTYADLTSGTTGTAGTVTGAIGSDGLTYNGDVYGFQASNSGGTNPWVPTSTYTSATVPNAPTDGAIIAINDNGPDSLTFTTPVTGLIMDVFSLGGGSTDTTYTFNEAFTVLSCGANAYYGGGCFDQSVGSTGTTLSGIEANGTIEFTGDVSTLSFTVTNPETYSGFDFGQVSPAPTPEPSSLILLGSGLLTGAGVLRRRLLRK